MYFLHPELVLTPSAPVGIAFRAICIDGILLSVTTCLYVCQLIPDLYVPAMVILDSSVQFTWDLHMF